MLAAAPNGVAEKHLAAQQQEPHPGPQGGGDCRKVVSGDGQPGGIGPRQVREHVQRAQAVGRDAAPAVLGGSGQAFGQKARIGRRVLAIREPLAAVAERHHGISASSLVGRDADDAAISRRLEQGGKRAISQGHRVVGE